MYDQQCALANQLYSWNLIFPVSSQLLRYIFVLGQTRLKTYIANTRWMHQFWQQKFNQNVIRKIFTYGVALFVTSLQTTSIPRLRATAITDCKLPKSNPRESEVIIVSSSAVVYLTRSHNTNLLQTYSISLDTDKGRRDLVLRQLL